MRITLTLDDDLASELRNKARRTRRPFKEVVNEAIRRVLVAGTAPVPRSRRFRVRPTSCGFQPGVDLEKLNQLLDE